MEIHRLGSYVRTLIFARSPQQRELDTLMARTYHARERATVNAPAVLEPGDIPSGEAAQQQGGAGHYGGTAGPAL